MRKAIKLLLIFLITFESSLAQENDRIDLKLIDEVRYGNIEKIDSLLSMGADVNYEDSNKKSAILYLDMWLSGWGDGGFSHQAKIADLLLEKGAKLDLKMIERPDRILEEAKRENYLATLMVLESDLSKIILEYASDSTEFDLTDCKTEVTMDSQRGDMIKIIGCMYLSDGTEVIKGNQTIYWGVTTRIKAKGKIDGWEREGRWVFYDKTFKLVGFADYYNGKIKLANGIIH